jgi:NAD(P)-dependent dehydrogenase (short-subunit alcohol dehydrogenase family)
VSRRSRRPRRVPVPELRGKRCLITGAASGIGRATALAAAARGAELFLTDVQEEALARVVEEARAAGGVVRHAAPADLADHDAVVALAGEIFAAHGAMDVVMNVAGIATWGTIDRLEHHHWQRVVDVNLMGPISVLECFVPPMIAAGRGGQIVNVSSAAGLFGLPWHAPYSATKFGLRGVSEVLRFDLRRDRIGVTLVCPGAVRTPLAGTVTIVGVDRERPDIRAFVERFERRAVSPEHVARRIIDGIEHNRYLVFTSPDIRWVFWLQRIWPLPYELLMRAMNRYFTRVVERR